MFLVVAYVVTIFFLVSFAGFGAIGLFVLLAVGLSKVPLGSVLRSIRPILYIMLFTVVLSVLLYKPVGGELPLVAWWRIGVYKTGLMQAGKMACRLVLLVVGPSLLTLTTTPTQLTDAMEWWLKPFALIKLPVQELALIMSIALRMIPTLIAETDKIVAAQKARCANFDSKNLVKKAKSMLPVLIPLFVSSFNRADELADAIDSRCYGYTKKRTKLKKPKFACRDLLAVLLFGVFGTFVLLVKFGWVPLFGWMYF